MDRQEIIKRVLNIYPQASTKIDQAYIFLKENFIDTGFAKYYWTLYAPPLAMSKITQYSAMGESRRINKERQEMNRDQEEKKEKIKPLQKIFMEAMMNPFLVLLFSFMTIDEGLLYIIKYNQKFRAVFDLTFKIKYPIDPDDSDGVKQIKNIVKNFGKSPEIKQPEIKKPEIKQPETKIVKTNKWVEHVRAYAKSKNISYACAISEASKTYKK